MNNENVPYIVRLLAHGEESAKSQEQLQLETGLSKREQRAAIYNARCMGAVILSNSDKDNGGYYLPANNDEIRRYIAFPKSRINSAREAVKSAEEFLRRGGVDEHI